MWKYLFCLLAVICVLSDVSAQQNKLIETEKIFQAAFDIVTNRKIADVSQLKPISVSYNKVNPIVDEGDTIQGMEVGETLKVLIFKKEGETPDGESKLKMWRPINVWLDINNDTSKAIVKVGSSMTTGGKGYSIKNKIKTK